MEMEEEEGARIPLQYIFCCICHCIIYSVYGKGVMVSPLDKKDIVKLKQQKRLSLQTLVMLTSTFSTFCMP